MADASAAVAAGKAKKVPLLAGVRPQAVERERLDWIDAATHELPVAWHRVVGEAVAPASLLAGEINATLAAVQWPAIESATGITSVLSRHSRAMRASKAVVELGRSAVRSVVGPLVAEPTQMIHEAYRNLDELTELARD